MGEKNLKQQKMTANQIAIHALAEQGVKKIRIAEELNISPAYVTQVTQASKKFNLAKRKHVKTAIDTIVSLCRGEPVGTITQVKDSTALTAAGMIYERYDPSITRIQQDVRTQSIQINHDTISAMTEFLTLKHQIDTDKHQNVIDISTNDIAKIKQV